MTWKPNMTRAEHLQWCRERAMQEYNFYVEQDPKKGLKEAASSMVSDIRKHPETQDTALMLLVFVESQKVTDKASLVKFLESVK